MYTTVETRLDHPGYLGHLGLQILSRSSELYSVYKISGSDLDSALDHVTVWIMVSKSDQSNKLGIL